MQQTNTKPPYQYDWLEQITLVATSLVWTGVVLLIISFVWAYQDSQAQWEIIRRQSLSSPADVYASGAGNAPLSVEVPSPTLVPSPTPTPASTETPTPTPTYVIGPGGVPPAMLPETPLEEQGNDPTPTLPTPTNTPIPHTPTPEGFPPPTDTPVASPPPATSGPTRLVIPSIGIDTSVVPVGWHVIEQNGNQYSVWDVADYVAGWHETSAPPGVSGNTVLAGHHNIKGEVFRYLVDVEEGDLVELYVGDVLYQYLVEQRFIVKEKGEPAEVRRQNAQWIAPTSDVRVTLVTCWPYTNNTHRVIVVAKPI